MIGFKSKADRILISSINCPYSLVVVVKLCKTETFPGEMNGVNKRYNQGLILKDYRAGKQIFDLVTIIQKHGETYGNFHSKEFLSEEICGQISSGGNSYPK